MRIVKPSRFTLINSPDQALRLSFTTNAVPEARVAITEKKVLMTLPQMRWREFITCKAERILTPSTSG